VGQKITQQHRDKKPWGNLRNGLTHGSYWKKIQEHAENADSAHPSQNNWQPATRTLGGVVGANHEGPVMIMRELISQEHVKGGNTTDAPTNVERMTRLLAIYGGAVILNEA
jgi:hypothetical protein